jgi:diguanylate cyclase (GGDEF)-like protein
MNYAFLPDLSALTILIVILLVLRSRHPQQGSDPWLLGLFFTLVEAVAHTFYPPTVAPTTFLHVIVVDCYLLAGLAFTLASGEKEPMQKTRLLYVGLNGLPLLLLNTLYGLHLRSPEPYFAVTAVGLVMGAATSVYLRGSWVRAGLQCLGWLAIAVVVRAGNYREVVYWSLCCVYSIAAFNFQRRLPAKSTGKLAIVTGFSIWSLCFLLHPWVVHYAAFSDIASHVWNMQKSLIAIGMILLMLEEQVSSNEWLALHDELTGLPNRRAFEDRLTCALDRSRRRTTRLALLMLDLNDFKKINDSLGHQAGDQVLRELAKNLRAHVQSVDTLARLGGDEFTMIASDLTEKHELERLLDEVRHAVERPLVVDGQTMMVTASLGLAVYPDDARDAEKLLWVADQRMYLLKPRRANHSKGKTDTKPMQSPSVSAKENGSMVGTESSRRRLRTALAEDATSL